MKSCNDCAFFAREPHDLQRGQCRRHPPVVLMAPVKTIAGDRITPIAVWPGVDAAAWCGDWSENWREPCGR